MGVTEAVLRLVGTVPDCREELMMSVMLGHSVGRQAFTNVVGMGSREHVEALALLLWRERRSCSVVDDSYSFNHVKCSVFLLHG